MKKLVFAITVIALVVLGAIIIRDKQTSKETAKEPTKVEQSNNDAKEDTVDKEGSEDNKGDEVTVEEPAKVEEEQPLVDTEEKEEKPEVEAPAEEKEDVDNSEGNSRPEAFYVEELITNFSTMYPSVVNKENIDISLLDNIIMPNSAFSKYISEEVKSYKDKKASINFETFDIESIKDKDKDSFEVIVNEVISITTDGKKEEKKLKAYYTVQFTKERMGISEIKN